jgi:AAA15 family ATPase/GTPase
MINSFEFSNIGNISKIYIDNLSKINLIIGENDSGKTLILKSLYVLIKAIEEYKRGDDNLSLKEILNKKIYWTFQVEKFGDLVKKRQNKELKLSIKVNHQKLELSFGKTTKTNIQNLISNIDLRKENSIFLPAKEVLSLFQVIKKSRAIDKEFGFDDTYYDLVLALEKESQKGNNFQNFTKGKKLLNTLIKGKVEYQNGNWIFKKGNIKIPIFSTAEGIKKIAILDRLLSNRYLTPNSIIFIDEPESVLHPKAIIEFLEIIYLLSKQNIQIFMATHSYFVLKKMMLIAKKYKINIPIISILQDNIIIDDLYNGIPDNPIIDTSIELYEEELDISL